MNGKPCPPAAKVIEGLSHSRDQYGEAIAILHQCYHKRWRNHGLGVLRQKGLDTFSRSQKC